jgi:pyruvate formate lyase activating enzyme
LEKQLLFYSKKCIGCSLCAEACERGVHKITDTHEIEREHCIACGECAAACPAAALEISGREMTAEEIVAAAERDRAFFGDLGGVTLSGGEPFFREGIGKLASTLKKGGFSVAVETCGAACPDRIIEAAPFIDLYLFDLKDTDAERHKAYTGVALEPILKNLRLVDELGGKIRLRCILVNGVNTDARHFENIEKIAAGLRNLEAVELIPYHAYAGTKATFLGNADNGRVEWIPDDEQLRLAKEIISRSVKVI